VAWNVSARSGCSVRSVDEMLDALQTQKGKKKEKQKAKLID
jgi:hypothetical protein